MKILYPISFSLLIISTVVYADFEEGGQAFLRGDYENAATEFISLAKRGDHRAMYALGTMYSAGLGVEKNLNKSFKLFSEAVQNGRYDAMYKLGLMYELGEGVDKNIKKAVRLYQKSAKSGYPYGQYRFGMMYSNGTGVKFNPVNAYAWLVIASHYFIYKTSQVNDTTNESFEKVKYRLLFEQQQENERILDEITQHLHKLKKEMSEEDIEKTKQKVIKISKSRKKYQSVRFKNGRLTSNIENLFLPDTLYY